MKRTNRILIGFLAVMIFLVSVLGAVSSSIFEQDFYTKSQIKHNAGQRMNLNQQQVTDATTVALLYTKGVIADLVYETQVDGETVDLYSSQDKEHMIDVKDLYYGMYYVLVASVVAMFITAIVLVFRRKQFSIFGMTYLINQVSLYSIIAVGFLAMFAWINFEQFWTFFHKVFFRNDLWLMNYNTDLLVNIFPEGLFMDLVFKIILRFTIMFGLINLTVFFYRAYSIRESK